MNNDTHRIKQWFRDKPKIQWHNFIWFISLFQQSVLIEFIILIIKNMYWLNKWMQSVALISDERSKWFNYTYQIY